MVAKGRVILGCARSAIMCLHYAVSEDLFGLAALGLLFTARPSGGRRLNLSGSRTS